MTGSQKVTSSILVLSTSKEKPQDPKDLWFFRIRGFDNRSICLPLSLSKGILQTLLDAEVKLLEIKTPQIALPYVPAGGYVLVSVLSFAAAVFLTVFCIKRKDKTPDS